MISSWLWQHKQNVFDFRTPRSIHYGHYACQHRHTHYCVRQFPYALFMYISHFNMKISSTASAVRKIECQHKWIYSLSLYKSGKVHRSSGNHQVNRKINRIVKCHRLLLKIEWQMERRTSSEVHVSSVYFLLHILIKWLRVCALCVHICTHLSRLFYRTHLSIHRQFNYYHRS